MRALGLVLMPSMLCCTLLIAAANESTSSAASPGFFLMSPGDLDIPSELKTKMMAIMPQVVPCIMAKKLGMKSKLSDVAAAVVGCVNNGKDNTACCKEAGLTDDKCVEQLCNGTPPIKLSVLTKAEAEKCNGDRSKVKNTTIGVLECYVAAVGVPIVSSPVPRNITNVNVIDDMPPAVKQMQEQLAKLMPKVFSCVTNKPLSMESQVADVFAYLVECANCGKDNRACCQKAGMTGDNCTKQLCDGTPPTTFSMSAAEAMKCLIGEDSSEMLKCFVDSQP